MNKTSLERLYNGLVKENPTFVLMLGMCPTLAVTTSAMNGMGMGLTTAVVLTLSNVIISLMRKIIPSKVRIPAFIVIIASFVTIVQLLLEAYLPSLNESLGVYIPLIVVNCIILGRAEAYAYSNPPIPSLFDGIGMGLGFTVALTLIGAVREVLGAAKIFGIQIPGMVPIGIFVLAPGAFFVLAVLTAIQNFVKIQGQKRGKDMSKIQSGCNEDCMNCSDMGCGKRFYAAETVAKNEDEESKVEETVGSTEEVKVKQTKKTTKKANKVEAEIEFIDLDEEVAEELEADAPKTEVKDAQMAEIEDVAKTEAEDAPKSDGETVVEVAKPKRKPRKKTVKDTPQQAPTEMEEEAPKMAEELEAGAPKTEAEDTPKADEETAAAVAKPKRKPRKKSVKAEPEQDAEEVNVLQESVLEEKQEKEDKS